MPHPKPIEKVELSEKHPKRRFYLAILFLVIGVLALVHAVRMFFSTDAGWTEVSANSASEINCSEDFVFLYELGAGDISATAENKALSIIYTDAAVKAFEMFNTDQAFTDLDNMYSINHNPNEVVEVEDALYQALELVQTYGDRKIYLGPVYAAYDDMFFCQNDSETIDFDPYQNEETAAYYAEIASYACDPEAVNVELLGDNQVRLDVSEEYLAYAEENGITNFIDFFWMKNAFIADYIADVLVEQGYTRGCISSYDGFVRNLDDRGESYSFGIYNRIGNEVDQAAIMEYSGQRSIVYLRNYMMSEKDMEHYYELGNGEIRTSYLDIADGLCKSSRNDLVSYSDRLGCAEIMLQISPIFISESWNAEAVNALAQNGIYSIYVEDGGLNYNEDGLAESEEDGTIYLKQQ